MKYNFDFCFFHNFFNKPGIKKQMACTGSNFYDRPTIISLSIEATSTHGQANVKPLKTYGKAAENAVASRDNAIAKCINYCAKIAQFKTFTYSGPHSYRITNNFRKQTKLNIT